MSLTTVRNAICAKLLTVAGIHSAPTRMPASINSGDCPLALVLPGPCSWSQEAIGLQKQLRTWIVRVYVKPVAQGQPVEEGFADCEPILQALATALLNDPTLGDTVDTLQIKENQLTDNGIGDYTFGDVHYVGFEMRVPIKESYT